MYVWHIEIHCPCKLIVNMSQKKELTIQNENVKNWWIFERYKILIKVRNF